MYISDADHSEYNVSDEGIEVPFLMEASNSNAVERFDPVQYVLEDQSWASQLDLRTCGELQAVANLPLARLCDPVRGHSLRNCLGGFRDCTVALSAVARTALVFLYTLLKNEYSVDGLTLDKLYVWQDTLTIAGVDNRKYDAAAGVQNIKDLVRALVSLVMQQPLADLKYQDASPTKVEEVYRLVQSSPLVDRKMLDKNLGVLSSYDTISMNPLYDGKEAKLKLLHDTGYGFLLNSILLTNEDPNIQLQKLKELIYNKFFSTKQNGMLLSSLMPIPDI